MKAIALLLVMLLSMTAAGALQAAPSGWGGTCVCAASNHFWSCAIGGPCPCVCRCPIIGSCHCSCSGANINNPVGD